MTPSPLDNFPVIVHVPVQWGDMDAYGHVNNTMFFKLFETARIAYLERCGFIDSYTNDRVGAILHSTQCRFRRPLFYPDAVRVGAKAVDISEDRFTMGYVVVSDKDDAVAAEGSGVIVSFDYAQQAKTSISDPIRQRIEHIERGDR